MRRRIFFISTFLLAFLVCVGIYYTTTFIANRPSLVGELKITLKEENYNIEEFTSKNYDKFDYEFMADNYDITENFQVVYRLKVLKKNLSGQVSELKYKVNMSTNWTGLDVTSSDSSTLNIGTSESGRTTTVRNIEVAINNSNFMIPTPKPKTTLIITYKYNSNGITTRHADIITFNYDDLKIVKGGYDA